MSQPQVQGLFLSGGLSSRMGQDKALLRYTDAQPEVLRWKAIFDQIAMPFYWSQRPLQYRPELFPDIERIVDETPGSGPLGALLSAHHTNPEGAWLVLACDWPLLGLADIRHLLDQRLPEKSATCYIHLGYRQPLFSIYEPAFLEAAARAWGDGQESLYRLLQDADVWEVAALDDGKFLNVNDNRQRDEIVRRMQKKPGDEK